MEPQIQYAKTSDGVSIAYAVMGTGRPLVVMPMMPISSIDLIWDVQSWWLQRLAQGRMLICYDNRGSGLSERDVSDLSMEAMVLDLESVVRSAGVSEFALLAFGEAGPTAITYAVRNSLEVSRLVLWESMADKAARRSLPRLRAIETLAETDWETYTEAAAHIVFGWESHLAHSFAVYMRRAVTRETFVAFNRVTHDATGLLADVQAPTLVAHERGAAHHMIEFAKELAAGIPNARLLVADVGEDNQVTEEAWSGAIEFLDEDTPASLPATELPSGTAIILFADIADSTALTERLGDAAFREKARELDEALRRAIASNGGRAIDGKLLGDGVLATFGAAREAIACAQEIHSIARTQSSPPRVGEGLGEGPALLLHVGIHAGDVIRERALDGRDNVYGGAVNIASRVASEAAAGETLVSATVRDLARTSAGVSFEDRGERELKGVGEPVRVFAVRSER